MPLQWSTHGAIAVAAAVAAIGMARVVYSTRPDRLQNRWLAGATIIGGLSVGLYFGAPLFATDPQVAGMSVRAGVSLMILLPPGYLLFLRTIPSPLTRGLRSPRACLLIGAYGLFAEALWLLAPERFLDGLAYYPRLGGWHLDLTAPHAGFRIGVLGPIALVQIYGFLVAISAYRHAATLAARRQARAFALAFGARDLLGVIFIGYFGARSLRLGGIEEIVFILGIPVMDLLFYFGLAYGILETQLFDIDLRLKLAFERSLVAAPFAASFFVATEALERSLPFESFWLAVGSAGTIVIVLRPIRLFASRIADRVLPGVDGSPEYLSERREEVFRHAVEAILEDDRVSEAERRVLDRLGHDLALGRERVAQIEAEVRLDTGLRRGPLDAEQSSTRDAADPDMGRRREPRPDGRTPERPFSPPATPAGSGSRA